MKYRQFLLIILLGFGLISGCNSKKGYEYSRTSNSFLTLTMALNKQVYKLGDPIIANLVLKNMGEQAVLVNKRMVDNELLSPDPFRDVSFLIVAPPLSQALPFGLRVDIDFPDKKDFVTLSTGEEVDATYELQYDYMFTYEPGNYIVIAYYKNIANPDDGRVAWKGELTSNLVKFKVEP